MALIFDKFPTQIDADIFIAHLEARGVAAKRFDSQDEMESILPVGAGSGVDGDIFPFALQPPIVLVTRNVVAGFDEDARVEAVTQFGGHFAGT